MAPLLDNSPQHNQRESQQQGGSSVCQELLVGDVGEPILNFVGVGI